MSAQSEVIVKQDMWAFRKAALLLSRIRYEDKGHGQIRFVIQDGIITLVEVVSTFRANGEQFTA